MEGPEGRVGRFEGRLEWLEGRGRPCPPLLALRPPTHPPPLPPPPASPLLQLLFSNINEGDVTALARFNAAAFPDALALARPATLAVGTVDAIQRLHVRAVPLGVEPPRPPRPTCTGRRGS